VLVVDDEPISRGVMVHILQRFGYRVLETSAVLEAQHLAAGKEKIDLLITDLNDAKTSPLELALWFRALYPQTKVLLASDSVWELDYRLCELQQIGLLAKPFTAFRLARMVREVLD